MNQNENSIDNSKKGWKSNGLLHPKAVQSDNKIKIKLKESDDKDGD